MIKKPTALVLSLVLGSSIAACQEAGDAGRSAAQTTGNTQESTMQILKPLPGREGSAPALTQKTTVQHADHGRRGRDRDLPGSGAERRASVSSSSCSSGFYDDTPVSRVVPGFVAQFGVNWRQPHKAWKDRNFNDDPTICSRSSAARSRSRRPEPEHQLHAGVHQLQRRTTASPTRSTTSRCSARWSSGMDVVDSFVQVGDPSGGLDQERLWLDGGTYLDSLHDQADDDRARRGGGIEQHSPPGGLVDTQYGY